MTGRAFTPGPWKIFRASNGSMLGIGVNRPNDEDHAAGVTDAYGGLWGSGGEKEANARLIAAAPSMYADAEFLCARIREMEAELTDDGEASRQYFGHVLPAVARMESALAEARGDQ